MKHHGIPPPIQEASSSKWTWTWIDQWTQRATRRSHTNVMASTPTDEPTITSKGEPASTPRMLRQQVHFAYNRCPVYLQMHWKVLSQRWLHHEKRVQMWQLTLFWMRYQRTIISQPNRAIGWDPIWSVNMLNILPHGIRRDSWYDTTKWRSTWSHCTRLYFWRTAHGEQSRGSPVLLPYQVTIRDSSGMVLQWILTLLPHGIPN